MHLFKTNTKKTFFFIISTYFLAMAASIYELMLGLSKTSQAYSLYIQKMYVSMKSGEISSSDFAQAIGDFSLQSNNEIYMHICINAIVMFLFTMALEMSFSLKKEWNWERLSEKKRRIYSSYPMALPFLMLILFLLFASTLFYLMMPWIDKRNMNTWPVLLMMLTPGFIVLLFPFYEESKAFNKLQGDFLGKRDNDADHTVQDVFIGGDAGERTGKEGFDKLPKHEKKIFFFIVICLFSVMVFSSFASQYKNMYLFIIAALFCGCIFGAQFVGLTYRKANRPNKEEGNRLDE